MFNIQSPLWRHGEQALVIRVSLHRTAQRGAGQERANRRGMERSPPAPSHVARETHSCARALFVGVCRHARDCHAAASARRHTWASSCPHATVRVRVDAYFDEWGDKGTQQTRKPEKSSLYREKHMRHLVPHIASPHRSRIPRSISCNFSRSRARLLLHISIACERAHLWRLRC